MKKIVKFEELNNYSDFQLKVNSLTIELFSYLYNMLIMPLRVVYRLAFDY